MKTYRKLFFGISLISIGISLSLLSCNNETAASQNDANKDIIVNSEERNSEASTNSTDNERGDGKVHKINTAQFVDEIFDYKANPSKWLYKGNMPAIVDFYADWCGPCKRVAPIMDKLAEKYKGKVNFYKINTDEEQELSAGVFGIQSIPSIIAIPVGKDPQMKTGAFSEEEYIKLIEDNLLK